MQGPTNESVGENFSLELLQTARDKTLEVINRVAAQIKPSMTEADAKRILQQTQEEMGAPKSWHPPMIRFGENSTFAFGKIGALNVPLKENDIYFLDIGPIFDGHEGDVGRAFYLGNDPEFKRCCEDVETIWFEVQKHWKENQITGEELYHFAEACALKRGWILALEKASGHRISDFPHLARGSIKDFKGTPAPNRWILEIQIRHPEKNFGAFYEDLLN